MHAAGLDLSTWSDLMLPALTPQDAGASGPLGADGTPSAPGGAAPSQPAPHTQASRPSALAATAAAQPPLATTDRLPPPPPTPATHPSAVRGGGDSTPPPLLCKPGRTRSIRTISAAESLRILG